MKEITTLNEFIVRSQSKHENATGELSGVLRDIVLACKMINREVNMAGLADIIGHLGVKNAYGEEVAKLDDFSNEQMISALKNGGECCGIASEEGTDIEVFDGDLSKNAGYVVLTDPLDGSSNIDVNVSIGTIFSIFKRVSPRGTACTTEDFLQVGREQVAAGYVIYGPSTMLVYTTGQGVHGFTLDPSIGEFCLSHENMSTPEQGQIFSINEGNTHQISDGVKAYIEYCKLEQGDKKAYSGRYIGSMVADLHRNLIKGGIFIYPTTTKSPEGKLRLLYECNPMAFIIEQAGGLATDGSINLMDIEPSGLYDTCPVYMGSKKMVEKAMSCLQVYDKEKAVL